MGTWQGHSKNGTESLPDHQTQGVPTTHGQRSWPVTTISTKPTKLLPSCKSTLTTTYPSSPTSFPTSTKPSVPHSVPPSTAHTVTSTPTLDSTPIPTGKVLAPVARTSVASPQLPNTGIDSYELSCIAVALIFFGIVLCLKARRLVKRSH